MTNRREITCWKPTNDTDEMANQIIYWKATGEKCGIRTGTINPKIGEKWTPMMAFLRGSDPDCHIYAFTDDGVIQDG